ncbi:MAG: hypothetical protein BroJett040_00440 [Oligoflexia bacterium]|nr:MAG: hypothetical protein BroJett040_00440 [Oligoflexia bacterium]
MRKLFVLATLSLSLSAYAAEDKSCTPAKKVAVCKEDIVKERVEWACKLIEAKGKGAIPEVNAMRFECCGEPNYVWINDMHPKMVMHPIKPDLNGKDVTENKDPDGKKLFVAFVEAVKKTPSGAWVDYKWTKFGDSEATPKTSWVKACKVGSTDEKWVVGSGTWK